jgi:hypothetical protein
VQLHLPKGERQAKVSEKVKDRPDMSKSEKSAEVWESGLATRELFADETVMAF